MAPYHRQKPIRLAAAIAFAVTASCRRFSTVMALSSLVGSSFRGASLIVSPTASPPTTPNLLTMRKQKASDRRTRRMQRGDLAEDSLDTLATLAASLSLRSGTLLASPMEGTAIKRHRSVGGGGKVRNAFPKNNGGGTTASGGSSRGRSRKRSAVYSVLASYQTSFLSLLTAEYRCEEAEVLGRIEASIDDPLALEVDGHALFDMFPERRGTIFTEEIYRLVKANDATTVFGPPVWSSDSAGDNSEDITSPPLPAVPNSPTEARRGYLPPSSKFASNDVVMLTLQPDGSGDFFGTTRLPISKDAASVEGRILNVGPTYIEVVVPGGAFEAAFGPAPNNNGGSGRGDPGMRLRVDRFFSRVPYDRMVAAVGRIATLPENKKGDKSKSSSNESGKNKLAEIRMDEVIRDTIISTHGGNPFTGTFYQEDVDKDYSELARKLAKPPLPNSAQLANQALRYMQTNPHEIFPAFNGPQMTAIGAALTRRLTMVQGPPGTGKTTVAAAIGFGFVHQCRNVSPHTKVLACAFSNVGADNLVERLLRLGLKVVRVGKASGVSEALWEHTLDAAVERDPEAQKALRDAARATANLRNANRKPVNMKGSTAKKSDIVNARIRREAATNSVKASIEACNVAATKALREADVIVSTSVGAADSRLLAACGIVVDEETQMEEDGRMKPDGRTKRMPVRQSDMGGDARLMRAPDGLPPLTLPFVIIDEACQSVEPATLIPVTSSNSCRALVMLGDPCQLPPTVKSDVTGAGDSPLAVSLMTRLSSTLPSPVIVTAQADKTEREDFFLRSLPTKQAVSLVKFKSKERKSHASYRKRYSGSLLLSVQYRMHPSISAFSSAVFYDSLLSTPAFLAQYRPFPDSLKKRLPTEDYGLGVRFVNVGGRNNERRGEKIESVLSSLYPASAGNGENTSYRNEAEANQILALLKEVLRGTGSGKSSSPGSIGIVTPYASQVALLKSLMASDHEFQSLLKNSQVTVETKSVDGYQGRERDLIIFSAVRSNRQGKLGFLTDWRRMNVALTRAKSGLVVFGDMETLKDGDKHWEAFANWCEGVGCVIDSE